MISCPSLSSSSILGSGPCRGRGRAARRCRVDREPCGCRWADCRHSPDAGARPLSRRRRRRMRLVVVGVETIELLEAGDDVADVEKAVALEAEVNEGRLHAGQHFGYPALVHVAHHAARALALDEDLGNLIVLEDRDPCFVGARGDDHLLAHARNSERVAARARGSLAATHQQVREQHPHQRHDHNLVSVGRVLTLQTHQRAGCVQQDPASRVSS